MHKFFDGAFGTYYFSLTNDPHPCEYANISNGDVVLSIHNQYIKSGVDFIKTNTFNANITVYKDIETVKNIITQGYKLAKRATDGTDISVFADIGYINCGDKKEAELQYMQIAEIFLGLGATNFLFETLCEFDVIIPAIELIKKNVPNATVCACFAVSQDGYTKKGLYYKTLLNNAADNACVDITGLNCACGPTYLLDLVKSMNPISKPLCIMPNAGYPSSVNGRTVYEDNAEYFAQKIGELYKAGASVLGGCCGTTPKHIELAVKAINSEHKTTPKTVRNYSAAVYKDEKKLKLKPLAVELDPPQNSDCGFISDAVEQLKNCGVGTITFADSPLAKARADSIMTAAKIKREKGVDVLPHLTCRDKNHIAIKGALLGASFDGIDKILAVTGDHAALDDNKKSGVFNFNSTELIAYIKSLNEELFAEKPFSIGGAINVNAVNFENELVRCKKKLESGASFLFSQPMFTQNAIKNFISAKRQLNCKLYAGILPIASYKNAIFLNNEVSGIDIPQNVIEKLKDKPTAEVYDISINYSRDIILAVYDCADGFYIMTPLKKVELVCGLISRCFDV